MPLGHQGTKVLTLVWTSKGEQDTEILSIRAMERFHVNDDAQKTFFYYYFCFYFTLVNNVCVAFSLVSMDVLLIGFLNGLMAWDCGTERVRDSYICLLHKWVHSATTGAC